MNLYENEILLWLFGIIVLAFLLFHYKTLRRLPAINVLFASYVVVLLAWTATNLEQLFWPSVFNTAEHVAYLASSLLLLIWCWRTSGTSNDSHD